MFFFKRCRSLAFFPVSLPTTTFTNIQVHTLRPEVAPCGNRHATRCVADGYQLVVNWSIGVRFSFSLFGDRNLADSSVSGSAGPLSNVTDRKDKISFQCYQSRPRNFTLYNRCENGMGSEMNSTYVTIVQTLIHAIKMAHLVTTYYIHDQCIRV